jgi:hypothetical protein
LPGFSNHRLLCKKYQASKYPFVVSLSNHEHPNVI